MIIHFVYVRKILFCTLFALTNNSHDIVIPVKQSEHNTRFSVILGWHDLEFYQVFEQFCAWYRIGTVYNL